MYLIDTNVISELRKRRPHPAVVAWLEQVPDQALHLSAVTVGELQAGIEVTRAQDAAKATEIETWVDQVAETWNVLPMDATTFRCWARLMHGRQDELVEDGMIAATAVVHGLTVVTRNLRHFKPLGVKTLDPFAAR